MSDSEGSAIDKRPRPLPSEGGHTDDEQLSAPYILEYGYKRSVGPVIGRFLAGLRDGRIEGARTTSGRVLVPPTEYDPETGEPTLELVTVEPTGVIAAWAWVSRPRARHPLPHPFAWALIRLDGAHTAILHAVDAGTEARITTGARVRVRWRDKRVGDMRDIVCFDLESNS
jgi:uncharacterized OB-fold protein